MLAVGVFLGPDSGEMHRREEWTCTECTVQYIHTLAMLCCAVLCCAVLLCCHSNDGHLDCLCGNLTRPDWDLGMRILVARSSTPLGLGQETQVMG